MRADARALFDIGHNLVMQIEKQTPELAHRVRQSQCAQFLCRLMHRATQPDRQTAWSAGASDVQDICDQVVKFVLDELRADVGSSERYGQQARALMQLKRMTQFLVLVGHAKAHMFLEVCVYMYTYIYAYIHVHTQLYMYTYIYTYIHVHTHFLVLLACEGAYVLGGVCIYVYTYMHACTSSIFGFDGACACAYVLGGVCVYIREHAVMCVRACVHACLFVFVCVYVYIHTYMYILSFWY
jgi:hypothetical protein